MLQYSSQYYQDIEGEVIHIHHLATDINYKGIGARIIDEIKHIAQKEAKNSIRLDNIGSNKKLNEYYEKHGFCQIAIIESEKYDGTNFGILRELKVS